MSIQERSRNYAMITYHPQEVIEKVLQGYMAVGRIRHYAWIVHDKDMDGDGKLKEKHIHLLLNLNNAMTVTAVRSLFPDGQNTLAQVVYDRACSFDYLIHKDKPDKYQYPDTDIVADDIEYWKSLQKGDSNENLAMCIVDDIINKVDYRTMVMRYSREYIINRHKYEELASLITFEENEKKKKQEKKDLPKNKPFLIDEESGEIVSPCALTKQLKMRV